MIFTEAQLRQIVSELNPIDDIMFRKMAEDRLFCEEMIRTILEDPNLVVTENIVQWDGSNLQGRSVRLDTKCVLGDGRVVNVEVQKSNNDDHQKRVRYNGAVLTTNITETGLKFEKVPDVIVIYISEFDIFREGKSAYHIDRVIRETGTVVRNGFTEIYVNAVNQDDTDIAGMMRIFVEGEVYDYERFPAISERKFLFKVKEEGKSPMSETLQKIIDSEKMESEKIGETRGMKIGETRGMKIGETRGMKIGEQRGEQRGEQKFALLTNILIKANRMDDLLRCTTDNAYKQQLFAELLP